MSFPIEEKFVIAVASSALFDLGESDRIFREQGPKAYKSYQEQNRYSALEKGVAFPFIRRFLNINLRFPNEQPVEVILLSRNSAATGLRVFNSIRHYGLGISRAAFTEGRSPYSYIPAFNAALFLSAHEDDVLRAIAAGYPAGTVQPSDIVDNADDEELRIAFDFDGVLADDEAESVYQMGHLTRFHQHEQERSHIPHNSGPLAELFRKIAILQTLEGRMVAEDQGYRRILRTAIITARNAPAHERVVTTLESWGVSANETFFLGGMKKDRILSLFKPHIFFDDQKRHLTPGEKDVPMVHIPFGIANQAEKRPVLAVAQTPGEIDQV